MCLWCAWTCKEARNEFITSMPRARRASAPTRVFVRFVMPSTQTEMKAESSVIDPPAIVPQTLIDGTTPDDGCVHSHRDHIFDIDYRRQQGLHRVAAIPEGLGHGVATATRSVWDQYFISIRSNSSLTSPQHLPFHLPRHALSRQSRSNTNSKKTTVP